MEWRSKESVEWEQEGWERARIRSTDKHLVAAFVLVPRQRNRKNGRAWSRERERERVMCGRDVNRPNLKSPPAHNESTHDSAGKAGLRVRKINKWKTEIENIKPHNTKRRKKRTGKGQMDGAMVTEREQRKERLASVGQMNWGVDKWSRSGRSRPSLSSSSGQLLVVVLFVKFLLLYFRCNFAFFFFFFC